MTREYKNTIVLWNKIILGVVIALFICMAALGTKLYNMQLQSQELKEKLQGLESDVHLMSEQYNFDTASVNTLVEENQRLQERLDDMAEVVGALIEPASVMQAPVGSMKQIPEPVKVTWYSTVPDITGTYGASGNKLYDGAAAMNQQLMTTYGLSFGDEVCIVTDVGDEYWFIIEDIAEANVIDLYVADTSTVATDLVENGATYCTVYYKTEV